MPISAPDAALVVDGLSAGYGPIRVLEDVGIEVGRGEFVAVLGANGVGKSTLLRAIVGGAKAFHGSIRIHGRDVMGLPSHTIVRSGVAVVPEGRQLVADLSVADNLLLGTVPWKRRRNRVAVAEALDEAFVRFPILAERRKQQAGSLSGGQQQLLAIARALVSRPRLLLLDEPSLGLAPLMVRDVFRHLADVHGSGLSILLAEQNATAALRVADRAYVLARGRVAHAGSAGELRDSDELRSVFLGKTH